MYETKTKGGGNVRRPTRLELKSERVQDTSPGEPVRSSVLVAEIAVASNVPGLEPVQLNLAVTLGC